MPHLFGSAGGSSPGERNFHFNPQRAAIWQQNLIRSFSAFLPRFFFLSTSLPPPPPPQAGVCEHAFCRHCITEWLCRQPSCPVDRNAITAANLRPVARILRNLLARLCITCDNAAYGCTAVLKLDCLPAHLDQCEHNPKRPLPCEKGCGFVIPRDELKDHNCARELRGLIQSQQQKMGQMKSELSDQNLAINELKRELQLFKEFVRAMCVNNPAMRAVADQMERDEVVRWSNTMPRARVTRWGGMISTPDDVLQVRKWIICFVDQSNLILFPTLPDDD